MGNGKERFLPATYGDTRDGFSSGSNLKDYTYDIYCIWVQRPSKFSILDHFSKFELAFALSALFHDQMLFFCMSSIGITTFFGNISLILFQRV